MVDSILCHYDQCSNLHNIKLLAIFELLVHIPRLTGKCRLATIAVDVMCKLSQT